MENNNLSKVWKQLPIDLVNKVLDVHSLNLQHDRLVNTLQEISFQAARSKVSWLTNHFNKLFNKHITEQEIPDFYDDVLLKCTDNLERLWLVTELNNCKCCSRHQFKRPTVNDYKNKFVPPYGNNWTSDIEELDKKFKNEHFWSKKNCKCDCRHMIRDICRADNDEIDESL